VFVQIWDDRSLGSPRLFCARGEVTQYRGNHERADGCKNPRKPTSTREPENKNENEKKRRGEELLELEFRQCVPS
jgi:hypothetical protein